MSASLVGSEMCIRDRPQYSTKGCFGPVCRPSAIDGSAEQPSLAVLRGVCLLYTSDAADDM
eukprot:3300474-Alexandrium_andersonii.AAC.1